MCYTGSLKPNIARTSGPGILPESPARAGVRHRRRHQQSHGPSNSPNHLQPCRQAKLSLPNIDIKGSGIHKGNNIKLCSEDLIYDPLSSSVNALFAQKNLTSLQYSLDQRQWVISHRQAKGFTGTLYRYSLFLKVKTLLLLITFQFLA